MQPRHIALAVLLSIFWGLNFVVITIALRDFPPLFLAAVRFAIAAVPILFLPRPPIGWPMLVAIGGTLFVGQFALLFPSMAVGMPPGLASIAIQVQAFITIGIAAAALRERPTPRQLLGCVVAAAGLFLIATTVGTNGVTLPGLVLALGSAIFWSIGNVLLRRAGKVDMLAMVTWMSLYRHPAALPAVRRRRGNAAPGRRRNPCHLAHCRRGALHRRRLHDLRLRGVGPAPEALSGGDRCALLAARAGEWHDFGGAHPR